MKDRKESKDDKKKEEVKKKKHKAHDQLFKAVFSKRREAANLLRSFGEPVLVNGLDFRTLRRETDSFTEQDLKEYFSDLVYSCRWKGTELRICVLFEHKSSPVKYPHFQLLRYMLNCWEQDIKQDRALRPVIPIVVYHGKEKWKHRELSEYFDVLHNDLYRFFPNFDYHLLDLSRYSDKNILALQTSYFTNTLYLLKHQREKKFILAHLKEVFMNKEQYLVTEEGQLFIKTMLHYLTKTNKFGKKEKEYLMKHIFETDIADIDPNNIDNTYDELLYEGYQKGMKEGEEKGREEGREGKENRLIIKTIQKFPNWTDKEVAEFVEVSVKKVREVRKTI